ncbi:heavy metal translocating P-type ATPase [Thermomicrobiaceae bacterium CFH 74404]|uniref:Heavy metal translocating P-type ATPase n=1 Tax=Thermalbibacter longus TaxID=2951981 RepID=A0AA41WDC3_9BACT|nr:heavy metal translocating P-type ATPase [Thermalbibacter longus]MCM8748255.1 heavy metal translocating P-type ATPase [Thermalbibacter longus]
MNAGFSPQPVDSQASAADAALLANGRRTKKLHLKVGGMHCSLCTASIERAVGRLDGVRSVHASIAHEEVLVEYDPERVAPATIEAALEAIGFSVRAPDERLALLEEERELAIARRKALQAAILLAAASALMLASALFGPSRTRMLIMAALALYAVGGPARFIVARNGWQSVRRGILNQDVLASASALAGLGGGLVGLALPALPAGEFFGATVFVLAFHLIGGYTSVLVHLRASQSVRRLLALVPPVARRVAADGSEVTVPVDRLAVGDLVRIRPGERIPVDGRVVEGASSVDESLVTGESVPVDKLPGSEVIGGALNLTGALVVQVTRVGPDTFLQSVARQVAEARAMKPGILRLVDQVLLVYVPTVFGASVLGLLLWAAGSWLVSGDVDLLRASFAALGALIMGYPCALGMATPLALIRASGEAAARGILMRSGEAFQVFRNVRAIAFDKTGTLTEGKPALAGCHALAGTPSDLLKLAASAEHPSEHPLARAIVSAARQQGIRLSEPEGFVAEPGRGVRARVEGHDVLVGTSRFLAEQGIDLTPLHPLVERVQREGQTAVLVAIDGQAAGVLGLADRVKADARATIEAFRRRGIEPILLSGDHRRVVNAVAAAAGIEVVRAEMLPADKAAAIRELQHGGVRVAMVGDGINDAPALMQADVGIAIGAGTDIAIEAADIVLIGDRLSALVDAYELARRSYRLTAANVALALVFNGAGIAVAVTGLVTPVWAMGAMAVSVSLVLGHSFAGRLLPRPRPSTQPAPPPRMAYVFTVPTIHCEGCYRRIQRKLRRCTGVLEVEGEIPERRVVVIVERGRARKEELRAELERLGQEVASVEVLEPVGERY